MSSTPSHNTWLDGAFWGPELRRSFIPEIEWFERTLRERVLPAFINIEGEADQAANQAWENVMEQPSDGNDDPGDFAEAAMEAGIEHFTRLSNVRQALVNMSAVALWHLVEQQILFFHKRQVLAMQEEHERELHRWQTFIKRMKAAGVDVKRLPSWPKIDELRVVANTVKHGEGNALDRLAQIRPDMLVHPLIRNHPTTFASARPRADRPAGGEDLYVTDSDLAEYAQAAIKFWKEVTAEIERVSVRP